MPANASDTIAAIATAPGPSGVALVRVSGPAAVDVAAALTARPERLKAAATHTVHHEWLQDASGHPLDETLVTVMRAPRTFTGEDVVEIGVHGGSVPARRVLRAVLAAGARLAERGEFTQRAFLNGRMDLSQAEAVVDLIEARTDRGADAALAALAGKLAERTTQVEDRLLDLLARLEVNLDFNEDVSAVGHDAIGATLSEAAGELELLRARAPWGRRLREGAVVALVGEPNVGKSSLFNALLQDDRAIVAESPGTTRDYLEAWIEIAGIPVRLVDTAGQRDAASGVEADGVRRAREWEANADVRVVVFDVAAVAVGAAGGATAGSAAFVLTDAERDEGRGPRAARGERIVVGNKSDLRLAGGARTASRGELLVSALTGEGVAELRDRIGQVLLSGMSAAEREPLPGERHEDAIRRAVRSLELATQSWRDGATEELIAGDVRDAAESLGEITGKTVGPEVLDRIFSRFCIGK